MSIIVFVILDLLPSALILAGLSTVARFCSLSLLRHDGRSSSPSFGPRAFGAPADDTFVIWSFLMLIPWTHSWETPNFSAHLPFCYSSRRRRDFMERVSGPLCADNDQSSRRGVISPSSPSSECWQRGRPSLLGGPKRDDELKFQEPGAETTAPRTRLSRPAALDCKCASVLCPELHFCLSNLWRRVRQSPAAPR